MSTEVYIYITRKSDGCPFGKYYLGGNGTKNSLDSSFRDNSIVIEAGMDVLRMKDKEAVRQFIDYNQDIFYSDNNTPELKDNFLNMPNGNDFSYWLIWDY